MAWTLQQECTFPKGAVAVRDFILRCTQKVCYWFTVTTVGSEAALFPFGIHEPDYVPDITKLRQDHPDVRYDLVRCQWVGALADATAMFSFSLSVEMDLQTPLQDAHGVFYPRLQTHYAWVTLTSPRPDECTVRLYKDTDPVWFGLEQPVDPILILGLARLLNATWNMWLSVWQGEQETGTEKPAVYVPERMADYIRWRAIWMAIQAHISKMGLADLEKWLEKMHPGLCASPDTLRKIIRAGTAGRLSTLSPGG